MNKVAVLGYGNLGMSIVRGLLENYYSVQNIIATKRNTANLDPLKKAGVQISSDNHYAAKVSDIIFWR